MYMEIWREKTSLPFWPTTPLCYPFYWCRPLKLTASHDHFLNSTWRQEYLLKSTCDMGLEIISDLGQGYFLLSSNDTSIDSATVICDMAIFQIHTGFGAPPSTAPSSVYSRLWSHTSGHIPPALSAVGDTNRI